MAGAKETTVFSQRFPPSAIVGQEVLNVIVLVQYLSIFNCYATFQTLRTSRGGSPCFTHATSKTAVR